jgi:hypothetical protein
VGLYEQVKNAELKNKLEEIETFVRKVWAAPRLLMGFTDHGPTHSQRVIFHIDSFLGEKVKSFSQDEAFVLLAACWLHDVAMQDYGLVESKNPDRVYTERLNRSERDLIRKYHAVRVKDILESSAKQVRLLDADRRYLDVPSLGKHTREIAAIAYGHSTKGFSQTCSIPDRPTGHVDPKPFRYDVLAALILLGDECDLADSRADYLDDQGLEGLDPVSALHLLKHRYVHSSKILISRENPEHRVLHIDYSWPESQSEVRPLYRRWIEGKLLEQVNLVQPTLAQRLGLEFKASRPISSKTIKAHKVERLPDYVKPFLEAERCRMDLANLENEYVELQKALEHCCAFIFFEHDNPGELGAADLCKICIPKIIDQCRGLGHVRLLPEIDILADPTGCDPQALIERITGCPLDVNSDNDREEDLHQNWVSRLGFKFREAMSNIAPSVFLIRNAHELPQDSKKLLAEHLVPSAPESKGSFFILITAANDFGLLPESVPQGVHICRLKSVSKDAIKTFLRRHTVHRDDVINMVLGDKEQFTQHQAIMLAEQFNWKAGDLT